MEQPRPNGLYYIQQVASMTGLSKQVIRKWEERYGLVKPERLDNGYRIYNERDVNVLIAVKNLSEQGHSVKRAALMVKEKSGISVVKPAVENERPLESLDAFVLRMLEKGAHCDELELQLVLQEAYHHVGLANFLTTIVVPFLKEVGNRWERGEWTEYQESLSSLVVRDYLVQIRRNFQTREDAPLILGACLPYERHEVPLHILLLQCMMKGWRTILIGASPAPGSIQALVRKLGPEKVLLSASTTIPFEKSPHLLKELDDFAAQNPDIRFYIGGSGSLLYTAGKKLNSIRIANSIEEIADIQP